MSGRLLVFGLGYSGRAVARDATAAGWQVTGTSRTPAAGLIPHEAATTAIDDSTHLLVTAPPDTAGDPVLSRYAAAIAAAPHLAWIGYLSTTGVYGDRGGGWVDESSPTSSTSPRGARRIAAERAWRSLATPGRSVDIFRLAGIYGPGRSVLDALRAGTAVRVDAPGHRFGRIHRDDIAQAVLAAMHSAQGRTRGGTRIFNLSDDEPAERARVIEEGARLLGVTPPPLVPLAEALAGMGEMARSFWAENRRVDSTATKATLGLAWRHPTYREGLRAILAEELAEHTGEQPQILRP